jgi:hypothetical protein
VCGNHFVRQDVGLVQSLELVAEKFTDVTRVRNDAKRLQLSLLAEASKQVRDTLPKRAPRKPKNEECLYLG